MIITRREILAFFAVAAVFAMILTLIPFFRQHRYVYTVKPFNPAGKVLVIDPGHGGVDGGAVSVTGTSESQINLAVALRLRLLADFLGVDTVMTRDGDVSIHDSGANTIRKKKVSDLNNRVKLINSVENAFLISIHQNTFTESGYSGAQVFFSKNPVSRPAAEQLQQAIHLRLSPDNTRLPKPVPDSVFLFKHITCPALLLECGFLSNPREAALLETADYQKKLALVIAATFLETAR